MMDHTTELVCAIIAGGKARRMEGRTKLTLPLAGKPLVQRIIASLPQQAQVVVNANDLSESQADLVRLSGAAIVPDPPSLRDCGPLAGLLSCWQWSQSLAVSPRFMMTVPGDSPFLPTNLSERLCQSMADGGPETDVVVATSGGRAHYLTALWRVQSLPRVEQYLSRGQRSVKGFLAELRCNEVEFGPTEVDPFFNINTPEDMSEAQSICLAQQNAEGGHGNREAD